MCPAGVLQEELQASGQEEERPPAVLKFRPAGSQEWQHPCVLQPGLHLAPAGSGSGGGSSAGGATAGALAGVHISKCCATTRILLLPVAGGPTPAPAQVAAEAAGGRAAGSENGQDQPLPLRIQARCRQLQVCLWDDERQRLVPPASPAGGARPPLGRELFAVSLDQLSLLLSRQQRLAAGLPAGAAAGAAPGARQLHPWQRQALQVMAARLTAAAAQVDSFLPGSEQPVLLTSRPAEDGGAARRQRRGPPLQLALEVRHCPPQAAAALAGLGAPPDAPSGGQLSLRNTWVHDLLVQLPTLAVAADDALLLFVDHLSGLLAAGSTQGSDSTSGGSGGSSSGDGACDVPGGGAVQQQSQLEALQQALAAEAAGAAASRLYIERAVVESGEQPPLGLARRSPGHPRIARGRRHAPLQIPLQRMATALPAPCSPPMPSPQCGCCWMRTSQRARRGCLSPWTHTEHPSR